MAEPIIVASESENVETTDKVTCKICRRQFSKYTCPTCNVAYCSLTCFRSESHSQCSETFYRKEVETGIQSEPSKSNEEKMKMMELLKRLEHQSSEEDPNLFEEDDDEADDETDLAQRLDAVDMDNMTPDGLWAILTPEEREKFMKALDNPAGELAQQLLASEELESERIQPWWEASSLNDISATGSAKRYGAVPEAMPMPSNVAKTLPSGSPLIYNITAVCIAYAYVTRYLSASPLSSLHHDDPDFEEARRIITQLVPFLTARNSKVLHMNLSQAVTDLWSRFEPGKVDARMFSLLLHDASELMRPKAVTVVSTSASHSQSGASAMRAIPSDHPSIASIRVLSDISKLLESVESRKDSIDGPLSHQNHKTLKLSFYAGQIISTPSTILVGVANEVAARSRAVEKEIEPLPHKLSEPGSRVHNTTTLNSDTTVPRIEELP